MKKNNDHTLLDSQYQSKEIDYIDLPTTETRRSLWQSAALLLGGSLFAQMLTVVTMPLVTRLFTTEEIGAVSVFVTFFSIPSACAAMRFDGALMVPEEQIELKRLTALSAWSTVIVSILSGVVLTFLSANKLFGLNVLPRWAGLLVVPVVCGLGFSAIFRALRLRNGDFSVLATIGAIRNCSNVIVRIVGGVCGGGIAALMFAELLSAWAAIRRLGGADVKRIIALLQTIPIIDLITTIRRWKHFPLYEIPSILVDQIAAAIPLLIVAERLGPGPAGLFAIANRFSTLPNAHIGAAVGDVFRSRFADYVRTGEHKSAKRLYNRLMIRAVLLALLLLLPMLFLVPHIFGLFFGSAWQSAGKLVPWLAAWAASALVVSPLSPLLQILQRQNLKWIYDGSAIATMLIAVALTSGTDLVIHVRALSLAGIAGNVVYFIILTIAVRRI
jgi:O-antigen/teichoic acid export membrane protein